MSRSRPSKLDRYKRKLKARRARYQPLPDAVMPEQTWRRLCEIAAEIKREGQEEERLRREQREMEWLQRQERKLREIQDVIERASSPENHLRVLRAHLGKQKQEEAGE